ncbi:hypothetical protein BDF19DRAFT_429915 [Syncephalis fuscata]|nr:hypothetical protein BDF19DRAFT_429915 [Syncephalis fuscata]
MDQESSDLIEQSAKESKESKETTPPAIPSGTVSELTLSLMLFFSIVFALVLAPQLEILLSSTNAVLKAPMENTEYVCRHNYSLKIISHSPFVAYIHGFLQDTEAEHIMELAKTKFVPSETLNRTETEKYRTSNSAILERSLTNVVECIEERATQLTGADRESLEYLQVVRYHPGQEYKKHTDFLDIEYLKKNYWGQFGQRFATILAYLHEPIKGGNTAFYELGYSVPVKKNDAVFWINMHPNATEDTRTTHAGEPVEEGEKWAINLWPHMWTDEVQEQYVWDP